MTLQSVRRSLVRFLAQIGEDAMLALCIAAPFIAGAAFRFGLPLAEQLVAERFGRPGLVSAFYPLSDVFVSFLTGYMTAFASAMVMLEERDNGTAAYLAVTPLGRSGYIFSRLAVPLLAAIPLTAVILAIFRLSSLSLPVLLFLSLAPVPAAAAVALFVVAFSGNRVEGLAMGKLAGLVLAALAVPFFVKDPIGYAAGIVPTYWVSAFVLKGSPLFLAAFAACSILWLIPLWFRFSRSKL